MQGGSALAVTMAAGCAAIAVNASDGVTVLPRPCLCSPRHARGCAADSNQLLHKFSPVAAAMLTVAAPLTELAIARLAPTVGTPLPPFHLSVEAGITILASALLGLLVSLSTFLVIGHTSALTYNVVGHLKTVGIVAGGVMFYSEARISPRPHAAAASS